jgi:isoflavone/4'-methoxyisoflavone 2'-hydroxylase
MNFSWKSIFISLALLYFIKIIFSLINKKKINNKKRLPPSPPAFPIIGHLHLLKRPLHQALVHISEKYGPATFLRFGSHPVLIIASRTLAEQCFSTHDIAFANRVQLPSVIKYTIIGTSNYGPYWHNIRQVAVTEALSDERLLATSYIRDGEVKEMVRQLFRYWKASTANKGSYYFEKLELKRKLFEMSLNMKMMVIAGKKFYGDNVDDSDELKQFRNGVEQYLALSGASILEDFLPILQLTDVFGLMRKKRKLVKLIDEMSHKLLEINRRKVVLEEKTAISNLIKLQKEEPMRYTDQIIQDIIIVSLIHAYVIKKLGYL